MSQHRFELQPVAPSASDWDWRMHARCRSMDTELFFPCEGEGQGARIRRERAAKHVCEPCSVRTECRNHALITCEQFGVWGGTTEKDRRHLRPPRRGRYRS
ncbi:WhiB family transcriptional regulator [Rhodococcus opacus RKJ300 = JCM 13270]|uniref:Transcriptional regulator WhiB n=2 Tax=Nocardiaceae TaxID=85025 RepID=I0WHH8_RHOOP|nr:WhiB family transcriptional regulator [Rhodococcus opacus RKJ300 = JCM 13270]QQZ14430.1 WhiB family transcriptional regulator [Rhodococcus sp. 21391]